MKLSQFKSTNVRKKLIFTNGEVKEVFVGEEVKGEITFYKFDLAKLDIINKEVVSKLSDSDSDEFLAYKIIPYITDVECDMTFEEFKKMLEIPSSTFTVFAQELIQSVNEMFSTISEVSKLAEASEKLSDNVEPQVEEVSAKDEIVKEKEISAETELDTDELLDFLFEQLSKTSNRDDRKRIIKRISDLQRLEG